MAVHLGGHILGQKRVGVHLVEVIDQPVIFLKISLAPAVAFGEYPRRIDAVVIGRVPVLDAVAQVPGAAFAVVLRRNITDASGGERCHRQDPGREAKNI